VGVEEQVYSNDRFRFECKGFTGEKLEKKIKKRKKSLNSSYNLGKNSGLIGSSKHWYLIRDYDNDEVMKSITCPILFLFAEYDINVDPEQNIEHLDKVFNNAVPSNFTVETMPKGQHGFYQVENRCVDWDTASQNSFDADFQKYIYKWIEALD
jgi:hypothetical protein